MLEAISHSKLKSWEFCPASFYVQYILGLDFYSPHFDFGTEYHKSVELYHLGLKWDWKRDRNGDILRDEAGEPVGIDRRNDEMISEYTSRIAQDAFSKIELKEKVVLHHPVTGEALALPMSLVIDRVVNNGYLSDLKTSKVAWNQARVDADKQATVYSFAWYELTGIIPEFEFVVVRKNPGPRTAPVSTWKTQRTISDFVEYWEWAHKTINEIVTATSYPCTCLYGKGHKRMGLVAVR